MAKCAENNSFALRHWLLILVPALTFRLSAVLFLTDQPVFQKYLTLSRFLLQPGSHDPFYSSPGYTFWVFFLSEFFHLDNLVIRVIQLGLGVISVVLVSRIAAILFNRKTGVLSGIIYASLGNIIIYESDLVTASLVIFLHLLCMRILISALSKFTVSTWVSTGITAGLCIIVRPNAVILIPLILVMISITRVRVRRKFILGVCLIIGTALSIAPVTFWNYLRSGEIVGVTASGGSVFYSSNNYRATGLGYSPPRIVNSA